MVVSIPEWDSSLSLSERFGATQALDEVDSTILRGEVVARMGLKGANQLALAKGASGLIGLDRGRVFVAGREMRRRDKINVNSALGASRPRAQEAPDLTRPPTRCAVLSARAGVNVVARTATRPRRRPARNRKA
jgi:ABC-type phosphonate transport system ATPase subunit